MVNKNEGGFNEVPDDSLFDKEVETENGEEVLSESLLVLKQRYEETDNPLLKQARKHYFEMFKGVLDILVKSRQASYEKERASDESLPKIKLKDLKEMVIMDELKNINESIKKERKSRIENYRDEKTGLFEGEILQERYNFEIQSLRNEKNEDQVIVLMMIDLNDFKNINDNFGHIVGDIALKEVADSLKAAVADRDLAVRQGGDEFSILTRKMSKDKVDELLNGIQKKLSVIKFSKDKDDLENKTEQLSLSIGARIVSYDDVAQDSDDDFNQDKYDDINQDKKKKYQFKNISEEADMASLFSKKIGLDNHENETVIFRYGDEEKLDFDEDWYERWEVKKHKRMLTEFYEARSVHYRVLEEMKNMGIDIESETLMGEAGRMVKHLNDEIYKCNRRIEKRIEHHKIAGRDKYISDQSAEATKKIDLSVLNIE